MARTTYAVVTYDKTTGIINLGTAGVKQTIDAITGVGNGVQITNAFNTVYDSLHFRINNTNTSAGTLTIKAGEFCNNVLGDLAIAVPASSEYEIKINQPDRLQFKDGSSIVEFSAGMTGTFAAIAEATYLG